MARGDHEAVRPSRQIVGDGKVGDDDFAVNGTIVDPGGPGTGTVTATPTEPLPTTPQPEIAAVPTLPFTGAPSAPQLALIALVFIFVGLTLRRARGRRRGGFPAGGH